MQLQELSLCCFFMIHHIINVLKWYRITKLNQTTYYLFIQERYHLITQKVDVRNTGYSHALLQEKNVQFRLFYETLIGTLRLFCEHSVKFFLADADSWINFPTLGRISFQKIFIFMDILTQIILGFFLLNNLFSCKILKDYKIYVLQ